MNNSLASTYTQTKRHNNSLNNDLQFDIIRNLSFQIVARAASKVLYVHSPGLMLLKPAI